MKQYLIRLDDACPTMDDRLWGRMEVLLDLYGVKPMVGVIPHNEDPKQLITIDDFDFWGKVAAWEKKGWTIALHGYNHCYTSNKGMKGLNPMWRRSEFAGLPLDEQREKIRRGVSIMRDNGLNPKFFFAPSHTFDKNTLVALREESEIRMISDTVGRYPYRYGDMWMIPQITGHCSEMPFDGIYTFCLHPNIMNERAFRALEDFLEKHHKQFVGFGDVDLTNYGSKSLVDKCLSWLFFTYRHLRRLY